MPVLFILTWSVPRLLLFVWLNTIFFPILLAFMAYENMQELQRSKY